MVIGLRKAVAVAVHLVLRLKYACGSSCSTFPIPLQLPETSGKLLVGHSYVRLHQHGLVQCATRCMRQKKCASFNFYRNNSKCELNKESHLTAPTCLATISTEKVDYYHVQQWDQNWLGACKDHDCPNDTVCESVSGSPQVTRMCMEAYSPDVTLPGCSWTTGCANCYPMRGIEFHGECYAANFSTAHFDGSYITIVDNDNCEDTCFTSGVGIGSASVMYIYKWN